MRSLSIIVSMLFVIGAIFFWFGVMSQNYFAPFTTEVKPLQDDEILSMRDFIKARWGDFTPDYVQCEFSKHAKCVAIKDKDQRPYRVTDEIFAALKNSIGGVWETEDFRYLLSVTCSMQDRPKCQAIGLVRKKKSDIESDSRMIAKPSFWGIFHG